MRKLNKVFNDNLITNSHYTSLNFDERELFLTTKQSTDSSRGFFLFKNFSCNKNLFFFSRSKIETFSIAADNIKKMETFFSLIIELFSCTSHNTFETTTRERERKKKAEKNNQNLHNFVELLFEWRIFMQISFFLGRSILWMSSSFCHHFIVVEWWKLNCP